MSFSARITTQSQFCYVPHTSVTGESWTLYYRSQTTSAGAAGGTTLVDSGYDYTATADALNGRYWVHIVSGSNQGQWKRIVDTAATTLTLENNGFSNQVGSAVDYEVWLSPEPVLVQTAADGTSTTTVSWFGVRAETADFWNDYWLIPITGAERGRIAKITDFTPTGGGGGGTGNGKFTHTAFNAALSAGDVCLIRKFVEASPSISVSQSYIPRPGGRIDFSVGDGITGPRSVSCSFTTEIRPSGSLQDNGLDTAPAASCTISGLFQAAGLVEVIGVTKTLGAGTTSSSLKLATGQTWDGSALPMGEARIVNGEMTFTISQTDGGGGVDSLGVSPTLSATPTAATDAAYATRMYRKSLDGDVLGCVVEYEVDGVRTTVTGCKGNVSLQDGEVVTLAWEFNGDHWVREIEAAPYNASSAYATSAPILAQDRIAYIGSAQGTIDTKVDISGFTCSPSSTAARRMVQGSTGINGSSGSQFTGFAPGATFSELLNSSGDLDQQLRWSARTAKDLVVIWGRKESEMVAVRIPVARLTQLPNPSDSGGLQAVPNVLQAQDAGSTADGGGTLRKVPDFAIFIS